MDICLTAPLVVENTIANGVKLKDYGKEHHYGTTSSEVRENALFAKSKNRLNLSIKIAAIPEATHSLVNHVSLRMLKTMYKLSEESHIGNLHRRCIGDTEVRKNIKNIMY